MYYKDNKSKFASERKECDHSINIYERLHVDFSGNGINNLKSPKRKDIQHSFD
jgi:hypothetical protein